jgi:hypothetical protein
MLWREKRSVLSWNVNIFTKIIKEGNKERNRETKRDKKLGELFNSDSHINSIKSDTHIYLR